MTAVTAATAILSRRAVPTPSTFTAPAKGVAALATIAPLAGEDGRGHGQDDEGCQGKRLLLEHNIFLFGIGPWGQPGVPFVRQLAFPLNPGTS
jgi:hypothetical protein